jgi:hypothetical protein
MAMEEDIRFRDLPPTPFELQTARDLEAVKVNNERERRRRRRANQALGYAEPKPGDKLHVQLDSTLLRRGRAGLRLERGRRVTVEVVDMEPEELALAQLNGRLVVSVDGAEQIIEDTSLHKASDPATTFEDRAQLEARNQELEQELQLARAEMKRMREARQAAGDSKQGEPARLQAAARARTGETEPQFGATTPAAAPRPPAAPATREPDKKDK